MNSSDTKFVYHFEDYPDFKPNLSPQEIFILGSFGGTYWRPIYSRVTNKEYKNVHKKYSSLKNLPNSIMTKPYNEYDASINRYGVQVGTTLEYWENKGWIKPPDPYGWVHWYVEFWEGRRIVSLVSPGLTYDEYQIKRWKNIKSRFNKDTPAVKQTLQHWGITL
jgi:hypothetical protein